MNWIGDVFTLDNLLHSLVAVAFTLLFGWGVAAGVSALPGDLSVPPGWNIFMAAFAAAGLYFREASQVSWDFALRGRDGTPSLHKHLEWVIGGCAAVLTGIILEIAL